MTHHTYFIEIEIKDPAALKKRLRAVLAEEEDLHYTDEEWAEREEVDEAYLAWVVQNILNNAHAGIEVFDMGDEEYAGY